MSRDTVPKHLANQLREKADANCGDCYGEGVVTYTASNTLGYREVRCACVDREPPENDDAWSGGFAENH